MTTRITPRDVRGLAEIIEGDSTRVAYALFELADQMEADAKEADENVDAIIELQNRLAGMWRIKAERDALAAKVAEG